MTMQDILDMKVMPQDVKLLTYIVRSMAREIIELREACNINHSKVEEVLAEKRT